MVDAVFIAREVRVLDITAHRLARRAGVPEFGDELVGVGGEALAWAIRAWHPDCGVQLGPWVQVRVRSAMIGELRRWYGRRGQRRPAELVVDPTATDDPAAIAVERVDTIEMLRQLPRRQRLALLAATGERAALAQRLGVHPSRVSQLRADARRTVRRLTA